MRAITVAQWRKMSARQRSWLVCAALGETAVVLWICVGVDGKQVGGGYQSLAYCEELIHACRALTAIEAAKRGLPFPHPMADAKPRPTACYPLYAEFPHLAARLGLDLLSRHGSFELEKLPVGVEARTGEFGAGAPTVTEAVCLLVLKANGLLTRGKRGAR